MYWGHEQCIPRSLRDLFSSGALSTRDDLPRQFLKDTSDFLAIAQRATEEDPRSAVDEDEDPNTQDDESSSAPTVPGSAIMKSGEFMPSVALTRGRQGVLD